MLVGDNRKAWDPKMMPDERVTHYWDEGRKAGCWYAERERLRGVFGAVVWDTYYLYGPDASWDEVPQPLIGSGYPIFGKRRSLAGQIAPLLGRTPNTPDRSVKFVGTLLSDVECPF